MYEDRPIPERTIRIYTEKETTLGFYDGMYYYSSNGVMLKAINSWEYVDASQES